jgi:hypothetical protein
MKMPWYMHNMNAISRQPWLGAGSSDLPAKAPSAIFHQPDMKTTWAVLLGLLLLAAPVAVQAQFTYITNSDGISITITGYTGPGGAMTIPTSINGLTVSDIGTNAFESTGLTSVTIPNSVTNIGDAAFGECRSLTAITVKTNNSFYSSTNGVLFNKGQTTLNQYPGGLGGSYTIPNSVTNIGDYAFAYTVLLSSVTIPNSVTSIGDSAFAYCPYLTSITIPKSVTSIGEYAFESTGLISVTIGDSVTSIGDYAFAYCIDLASITIPNSVTSIGDAAFGDCRSLTAITVKTNNSFYSSTNGVLFNKSQTTLNQYPGGLGGSYTIPNSVTNIGDYAFASTGLTSVTIPNSVTSIGDYAFEDSGLTSVTIPNSVTSIGYSSFAYTGLTSITIPNSVTSIGADAFYECTNLTSVYFTGIAPIADSSVFELGLGEHHGVFQFYTIATAYYLPGTTGWSSTFAGVPAVLWHPFGPSGGVSFGVQSNQFGFNFTGPVNLVIVVEAATNLANPVWIPLQTNTLTNGSLSFSDPQWTNYSSRFYRITSP